MSTAIGVRCPMCGGYVCKVDYTRYTTNREVGKRRRSCQSCGGTFVTHERVVGVPRNPSPVK